MYFKILSANLVNRKFYVLISCLVIKKTRNFVTLKHTSLKSIRSSDARKIMLHNSLRTTCCSYAHQWLIDNAFLFSLCSISRGFTIFQMRCVQRVAQALTDFTQPTERLAKWSLRTNRALLSHAQRENNSEINWKAMYHSFLCLLRANLERPKSKRWLKIRDRQTTCRRRRIHRQRIAAIRQQCAAHKQR